MIKISEPAWKAMVDHAEAKFPNECCGAMIGAIDGDVKDVTLAQPLENAYSGAQGARYELRPEDLLEADKKALRLRQEALEKQLIAKPATTWEEAAEKARYLLWLFASTQAAQDPRRKKLIANVLDDFKRLSGDH